MSSNKMVESRRARLEWYIRSHIRTTLLQLGLLTGTKMMCSLRLPLQLERISIRSLVGFSFPSTKSAFSIAPAKCGASARVCPSSRGSQLRVLLPVTSSNT